ncbi:MAG: class I SAM-dependent methyltransferase [Acidobacteriia bacterium]|nr:class I SAM-dependent methyltransferase [Terriglobia bacterium]
MLAANYACASCGITFPAAGNRPILINETNSVFRIPEIESFSFMGMHQRPSIFVRLLPSPDCNVAADRNYRRLAQQLLPGARILVLGAANGGLGTETIYHSNFTVINSDVWPGAVVDIILDAHDIPFPSESFDCVVAQAVLEHVADPFRCVAEIHRVLKPDGIVYAETPFMQQVHGAEYDFCRFTHLGHRRLFRWFSVIDSGIVAGPGMSLAWAWEYFWMSFVNRRGLMRKLLRAMSRLTAFWMPWCDAFLSTRLGAYDAASGFYFMGRKAPQPISDRDLLAEFRGVR